ncbi:MAG TPA: hypothetical protein PL178_12845 [Prevotella sp.]|nr:hypothetical protein [Prevotella sp.]
MDNQNTDNKIQQNEAQQPANATAQPTAEQGAEQTEQKQPTSYAVRPQHHPDQVVSTAGFAHWPTATRTTC